RVRRILPEDRDVLEVLARRLLEKEVVDEAELREIMQLPPRTREPSPERVVAPPPAAPLGATDEPRAATSADRAPGRAAGGELRGRGPGVRLRLWRGRPAFTEGLTQSR